MPPYALLTCAAAAILGTLAVSPLPSDVRLTVAFALAALCGWAWRARSSQLRVLVLTALAAYALNGAVHRWQEPRFSEQRTARYAGTILERTSATDGSQAVTIALDRGPVVLAQLRGAVPAPGAQVVVRGRLTPFDDARNPGEPSERQIQRDRGLDARLATATLLARLPSAGTDWRAWLARAHDWAHDRLRERVGEPGASVLAGELWGERDGLPPDLRTEFQQTGTVHVLVTAGLHLGALAAIVAALLAALALPRVATCGIVVALAWGFVWWSGSHLPAERAATMLTAALTARACGRATFSWNSLALAALAVAFARPLSVATASFALSFSCVGAIFACAPTIERWIEGRAALPARVREALVLAIATQAGTWPLNAAVFLQFTPYAILANVAIVPCVGATMALGLAQLAAAWCPPLAQAFANLDSWLLAWMLGAVRLFDALPKAAIVATPAPAWCIAAYDAALVAAPWLARRGAPTLATASLLLAAGWVAWPPRAADARLRVTVLDVGQADAIVVQTPAGHTLLVDAGGRLERGPQSDDSVAERVGERIVVPFLIRHGIHAIDAIVLSHPHGDHAGGLAPVLRALHVAALADSGQRYPGHAYRDAIATARAEGVPLLYPRAGTRWQTDDGVTLLFLGPSLPFIGGKNAINDNSIAFILQYRSFRMLFTGDAGVAAEQRFLAEGIDLSAAVLKVGHHGSAYSSSPAFVAAVRPRYAIVSVGRHNVFGHPAPSTIRTLRRFGATIYRTDENAAVTIATDGSTDGALSIAAQRLVPPRLVTVPPALANVPDNAHPRRGTLKRGDRAARVLPP